MKKIIIIGATSGIGREMARIYATAGHLVGVTGRRQELLYTLQVEFPNNIITRSFDVTADDNIYHLNFLIDKLDGLDLFIYNAGYGDISDTVNWNIDKTTVDTNVKGFIEMIDHAFGFFENQGYGQLVTTSSVASVRGNSRAPAYSASKAFQSVYFEGLHMNLKKKKSNIYVTDVQPGFIDTKMAKGKRFWVSSPIKAALQIVDAIEKKKWRVYITRRWKIIATLMKWMPDFLFHKIG